MRRLGSSIEKTHDWREAESYTIIFAEEVTGCTVETIARSEAVAKLLVGEQGPKPLAASAREDDLEARASPYLADDLAIVDWNSALVIEPSGSRIVAHVLELATCQLLEFRYYDRPPRGEEIASSRWSLRDRSRRSPRIFRSPFNALTRQVLRPSSAELTEFMERVDNAIEIRRRHLPRARLPPQRSNCASRV